MLRGVYTITMAWVLGTGFAACSKGERAKRFDGPHCGNGIVEPGEECDGEDTLWPGLVCDWDCHAVCFGPGTLVATPEGARPIEQVAAGDIVWSWNEREAVAVARRVVAVHKAHVRTSCALRTESARLASVTPTHPLYLPDEQRYAPVREIRQGLRLLVIAPSEQPSPQAPHCREEPLLEIKVTERPEPTFEVYHLSVEGPEHNFFADGVLAHNKQPGTCGDGIVDLGSFTEQCDDGNQNNADACTKYCERAYCGDHFVWAGVECCDPPDGMTCDITCMCLGPGGAGGGSGGAGGVAGGASAGGPGGGGAGGAAGNGGAGGSGGSGG